MRFELFLLTFFYLTFLAPLNGFSVEYDSKSLFFEHWRHYDSQGIACDYCHKTTGKGIFSLPDHDTCRFCHKPGRSSDYETSDKPICDKCHPTGKQGAVTRLRLVQRSEKRFFYHSDKLEHLCDVCHGKMLEDMVSMGELIASKSERIRIRQKSHYFYAKKTCDNCHHNMTPETKPENHVVDWAIKHQKTAPQFNCRICHNKGYCQDCHESTY